MTPPPTMTTRARVGRSAADMLSAHPYILGIEGRGLEHRRATPLALDEHVEAAARCCEFGRHAGKREALLDPMSIGAGGGHADAALADEHGLAAARVRVGRGHLGVHDLEIARRLLERRRLADKVGL